MAGSLRKLVSSKEAAIFLGVPAHQMCRLDPEGEIIKRYKLTRKTHVYDMESLQQYLDTRLMAPAASAIGLSRPHEVSGNMTAVTPQGFSRKKRRSLLEIAIGVPIPETQKKPPGRRPRTGGKSR